MIQTDEIKGLFYLNDIPNEEESNEESESISESSSEENTHKEISETDENLNKNPQNFVKKNSTRDTELEKEDFLIELKRIVHSIKIQADIDIDSLIETIVSETKHFKSWLYGFKIGLSLKNYTSEEILINSKTNHLNNDPNLINPASELYKTKPPSSRRTNMLRCNTIGDQNILMHSLTKEIISANLIIAYLQSKSMTYLQKYSKITKKKLLKHISQYIYLGIGKKFNKSQNFADIIFQALFHKYNIKSIAERKFKEIAVGCLVNYQENTRIKLFLCCLGLGNYFKLRNLSTEACELCLKCYEFMITSKTGVILDSSDPLYIKYYPVSRAIECAKLKFENLLPRTKLNSLYSKIEILSESDQNRINKTGVIDLDKAVELFINTYEEYQESVINGVNLCVKIVSEYNYLTRSECLLLFKHLTSLKQSLLKFVSFDEKNEVDLNDFRGFCINKGILQIENIELFFSKINKNPKEILEKLEEYEKTIENIIEIGHEDTLSLEEWLNKFEDIKFHIKGNNSLKYFQLWHLLTAEIDYLKSR